MGKLDARHRLTVVRRLCGHLSSGPSGVFDQSMERMTLPISPPPTSHSCCAALRPSSATLEAIAPRQGYAEKSEGAICSAGGTTPRKAPRRRRGASLGRLTDFSWIAARRTDRGIGL